MSIGVGWRASMLITRWIYFLFLKGSIKKLRKLLKIKQLVHDNQIPEPAASESACYRDAQTFFGDDTA